MNSFKNLPISRCFDFENLPNSNISPKTNIFLFFVLKSQNSEIDFFTSLIKEGKFINVVSGLTIFIKKQNEDGSYSNIYLDDSTKKNSKIISDYAEENISQKIPKIIISYTSIINKKVWKKNI